MREYDEAGVNLAQTELLEEQALLSMLVGDLGAARTQIERLIEARPIEKNEIGFHTASLAKVRINIVQGEIEPALSTLQNSLEYFRTHTLYYYEAQASFAAAVCHLRLGNEPAMLEHLRRTVDLAARYDYEYWLRREVLANVPLFALEEATELLPTDLRKQLAERSLAAPSPASTSTVELSLNPQNLGN